jgi:hypothetical protein
VQSESLPKNTEPRTNPHKNVDAILIRQIEFADAEAAAQLGAELGYPAVAEEMKEPISVVNSLRDRVVYVACIADKAIGWIDVSIVHHLSTGAHGEIGGLVISAP